MLDTGDQLNSTIKDMEDSTRPYDAVGARERIFISTATTCLAFLTLRSPLNPFCCYQDREMCPGPSWILLATCTMQMVIDNDDGTII